MPTLRTVTLGCKVNQYETQYLREGFLRLGYVDAKKGERADLCIVNTCTVTSEGDLKSRKLIRQLARRNPETEIIVMGCYATRAPEEVASLPNVVEVVVDKETLPDLLARRGLNEAPLGVTSFGARHRAYIKVQDGCTQHCAYCIIPHTRPTRRSRPIEQAVPEIAGLVERGYKEIVLTGIHLGHYGVDLDDASVDLAALVVRILELPGEFRLRLSSMEAVEVSDRLIRVLREHPTRVCPHLHLSMQSGSNDVLRRMRRRWMREEFLDCCRRIQKELDQPALTTDVIVGFPGETDADFEATCAACREIGFSKIHIFRYSPREGTPAATMADQIHGSIKQERATRLAELETTLRDAYFDTLVGRTLQVLVERAQQDAIGRLVGTSDRYAPVEFDGDASLVGRLVDVRAESVIDGKIIGGLVDR